MRKQTPRRNALALGMTIAMFTLGLLVSVFVAGSASASGPLPSSTTASTTPAFTPDSSAGFDANSPQAQFLVINGSVSATSDHEIVGSSAFPNYTTGAVDNYYSMSRSHMDNSPFSEGTASPADTGPVGQTAAAGNFQQPQYADARWPGGPDKADYGKSGQPFAEAGAFEAAATADASEASNGLSGPGLDGSKTLAAPKGFDNALTKALAGWKTKYLGCPAPPKKAPLPAIPAPKVPKVKVPKPKPPAVTTPTVTTPLGKVSVPTTASAPPAPSVPEPTAPAIPTAPATGATRSLSAVPSQCSSASGSESDGEHALKSSTLGVLVPGDSAKNSDIDKVDARKLETTQTTTTTDATTTQATTTPSAWKPKPYTMLLGGESSMGRVVLGHGQIVIDGIHVTASVANDGSATPAYKANVSVASASIGGVPVTIDQNGVHIANQGGGVPYKQASDGLNSALKQAGIQIFLVAPQVTNCGPPGGAAGTGTATTTTTTTTTTTSDQSGTSSACGDAGPACASGSGTGTDTSTTTTSTPTPSPTSTDQTDTTSAPPSSCPPPDSCSGSGTATDGGTTTTNGGTGAPAGLGGTTTTTTTSTSQTDTTSTTSSWCSSTAPSTSSCAPASTAPGTSTTSTDQSGTAAPPPGTDPMAMGNSGQETIVSATGVHVVFTQPVSPSGVPAQFVEHILGEVSVDSLAAPATPLPDLGSLSGGLSSSSPSSCPGGKKSSTKALSSTGGASGGASGGGSGVAGSSTAGGSTLGGTSGSGSLSGSGSGFGSASGTNASSTGGSLPATIAAALRKPLWLLLAYLVWQALVIGTGASLWNWRREDELP